MSFAHKVGDIVRYESRNWIVRARYEDSAPGYLAEDHDRSPWYVIYCSGVKAKVQESQLQPRYAPTCTASRAQMLAAPSFKVGDKVRRQYRSNGLIGTTRWAIVAIDGEHAWTKRVDGDMRTTCKLSDLVPEPKREIQVGDKVRHRNFKWDHQVLAIHGDRAWCFSADIGYSNFFTSDCELVP